MQKIALLFYAIVTLMAGCNSSDKFEYTPNGFPFKYHVNQPGESPEPGDEVQYRMYIRNGDSIIRKVHDTEFEQVPYVKVRLPMDIKGTKSPSVDALSVISPGDSITVHFRIDTLKQKPLGFEDADYIYYDIVMVGFEKYTPKVQKTPKPLPVDDYVLTPNGGYPVKFHINKEGPVPRIGDYVNFRMYIRSDKGVVYSTELNKTGAEVDPFKTAPFVLGNNPAPQMDAMSMMSAGDSLTLYYQIDTMERKPKGFEDSDMVYYDIFMVGVKTPAQHNEVVSQRTKERLDQEKRVREQEPRIDDLLRKTLKQYKAGELDVKIRNGVKGVKYMVLEPGKGDNVQDAKYVKHHFYCLTADGSKCGSSFPDGVPYEVLIGENRVVAGWEQGLKNLNQGAKAILFVPSSMAYGEKGVEGQIAPNMELLFYIDVQEIR